MQMLSLLMSRQLLYASFAITAKREFTQPKREFTQTWHLFFCTMDVCLIPQSWDVKHLESWPMAEAPGILKTTQLSDKLCTMSATKDTCLKGQMPLCAKKMVTTIICLLFASVSPIYSCVWSLLSAAKRLSDADSFLHSALILLLTAQVLVTALKCTVKINGLSEEACYPCTSPTLEGQGSPCMWNTADELCGCKPREMGRYHSAVVCLKTLESKPNRNWRGGQFHT